MGIGRSRQAAAMAAGCVWLGLGACQDRNAGSPSWSGGLGSAPAVEAPGVPIALESIEGAPEGVRSRLASAMATEASARRVEFVGADGPARYRVKGYLTAYEDENGGTNLAFVWDVFDGARTRARRVEGTSLAKATPGTDPWSAVDEAALNKIAARSMNEIAGFLAGNRSHSQEAPPVDAGKPLGFAAE